MLIFGHLWWREHQIAFSPGSCVPLAKQFVCAFSHSLLLLGPPAIHQVHRLRDFLWVFCH